MKNKTTLLIVAVNLAVLVLLAIVYPDLMISPGKPVAAHAGLATDCFACHTPFLGSAPAKCIGCHKVAEIGLKTTKGTPIAKEKKNVAFHQQLIEEDCMACHSEHKGVQPFRPIGQFSHELLEQTVQNRCDSCHASPGDALHRKIKGNCSSCHTQDSWTPATFDHEKYFRFDQHHSSDCTTCHVDNNYDAYTCYGCHEHSRSRIREKHVEEGIYDYEKCADCHRSGDEDEAKYIWRSKQTKQGDAKAGLRGSYRHEDHEHKRRDDD